jgi:hypothetical protein
MDLIPGLALSDIGIFVALYLPILAAQFVVPEKKSRLRDSRCNACGYRNSDGDRFSLANLEC